MPATTPPRVYDSDERFVPFVTEGRQLWEYRGLVRLLVVRDLTLRYKRSLLGVWWTLLNPVLTSAVMWVVFSAVFRFSTPNDEPFIVYLLAGVLLVTFFTQGVLGVGNSMADSAPVISKVYVPPVVFAVAAGAAAASNFVVALVPLAVVAIATGQGIALTAVGLIAVVILLLAFITGLGLLIASYSIRFVDTLDLVAVLLTLIGYLTPTFYPLTIVPPEFRAFVYLNPLYHYLEVLRDLSYRGSLGSGVNWLVMIGTAAFFLTVGTYVFSRKWRTIAAMV